MIDIVSADKDRDAFERSWGRCLKRGLNKSILPDINHIQLENNLLADAFKNIVEKLDGTIALTDSVLIITDKNGIVLDIKSFDKSAEVNYLMKTGMILDELNAGTNAISMVLNTGKVSIVKKGEHYIECFNDLSCIAAPIYDKDSNILGVIDITTYKEINDVHKVLLLFLKKTIESDYYELSAKEILNGLDAIDIEILKLLAYGYTDSQISKRIHVSISNVKYHKNKLRKIFDAKSIRDCIYKATKIGVI
ncbi:helix-turn-helix domain-containing protein [Thermoanaerobacterium butyriciformans]|uniref:Transcriptional regulator of acetoin/glycerol metabolism/DNA-binding CsgD family transcriptional regulator n=1 Tax=Thermoanaerobacterium butyriciformans TaxID=1702242 RepID=A0ABS4NC88_9THEO|nr:helix-turn-helix transcriptional regulator [Thermoanaerobacterium butyriciformans]MBP2071289.1 transcriptional regulator of acetoin/glycerol metabolism/DNA-binding CsgD family transcriptional regulator [Thermoanaerobacterium butyriciformans]